jgi:hypothetical protein
MSKIQGKHSVPTQTAVYRYHTPAGFGSTDTKIPYFSVTDITTDTYSLLTIVNNSTNGFSITANKKCRLSVTYTFCMAGSGDYGGLSKNATSPVTLGLTSQAFTKQLVWIYAAPGTQLPAVAQINCEVGDVIRPHSDSALAHSSGQLNHIYITAELI